MEYAGNLTRQLDMAAAAVENSTVADFRLRFAPNLTRTGVFIQTRQQVDGWEAFPTQSNALVPGHQWSLHRTVAGG